MKKEKIAERKALAMNLLLEGMKDTRFTPKISEAMGLHISLLYKIRSGIKGITLENAELIISHAPGIMKRLEEK